jgi:hypothetical protein
MASSHAQRREKFILASQPPTPRGSSLRKERRQQPTTRKGRESRGDQKARKGFPQILVLDLYSCQTPLAAASSKKLEKSRGCRLSAR